jgi:hypothetical protein
MKLKLIKGFVIAFAVAAIGMMSAVPQIDAQGVSAGSSEEDVQAAANEIYHGNKTTSDAYQQGWDQAEAQRRAAEENEDEEEGGCCGGS